MVLTEISVTGVPGTSAEDLGDIEISTRTTLMQSDKEGDGVQGRDTGMYVADNPKTIENKWTLLS